MGMVCIEKTTGRMREWVRLGTPPTFNPALHVLVEQDDPPPDGAQWNGAAWVPAPAVKSVRELDKDDALAKIDLALADASAPKSIKDALAAIKKVLG